MRYHVTFGERDFTVDVDADGVRLDGDPVDAELRPVGATGVHALFLDGATHRVVATRGEAGRWRLVVDGTALTADVEDERTRSIRELTATVRGPVGPRPLRAPMPGLVVKIEVTEGDSVRAGQGLVIMEAMKMENELRAESDAVVRRVRVEPGQAVEKDQVLIELAAANAVAEGEGS